jgi:hypothetical protein
MIPRPDNTEKIVRDYLDGALPEHERGAFLHRLRNDPAALDLLASHARMDARLRQLARTAAPVSQSPAASRRPWLVATAAAAACIALASVVAWRVTRPTEASFAVSPFTQYSLEGPASEPGKLTLGGTLHLTQGAADIVLPTGVKCIATAPSRITLKGRNELQITDGLAHFQVPDSGKGFTVRTPDLKVIDHGTEFTIDAARRGHHEAHVVRGKIEVRPLADETAVSTLTDGQAVRLDAGMLRPMASDSRRFMNRLPEGLPALWFPFDPEKSGDLPVFGSLAKTAGVSVLPPGEKFRKPALVTGRSGQALRFPDNRHSLQTSWPGIEGTMARSVSFWLRSEPTGDEGVYMPLVAWGLPAGPRRMGIFSIQLGGKTGNLHLRIASGRRWLEGATVLDDGRWNHVVVVLEGHRPGNWPVIKAYVNGNSEPLVHHLPEDRNAAPLESFYTVVDDPRSVPLTFGRFDFWRDYPSQPWEIDEVVIAAGILLPQQIEMLYQGRRHEAGLAVGEHYSLNK